MDALPAGMSKDECDARVAQLISGAVMGDPLATLDEKQDRHPRRCWRIWPARRRRPDWPWVARDVRDTRLPKLDDERFSVVVLGEFNHGKSTFINALLGTPLLPTGITPTTALLAHVTHGARAGATLVTEAATGCRSTWRRSPMA